MLKQNKGITLVALVITIIVLIILAGVTIATLSGPNGILTNANTATQKTSNAEKVEKINVALAGAQTSLYTGTLPADIKTELEKELEGGAYTVSVNASDITITATAEDGTTKIEGKVSTDKAPYEMTKASI